MTLTTTTYAIKGYWINLATSWENQKETSAVKKAAYINEEIFKDAFKADVYGFAKAICKVEEGKRISEWKVIVYKAELNSPKSFNKIYEKYKSEIGETEETSYPKKDEYTTLIRAIREVISYITTNPSLFEKPPEMQRKLNKLIIYLLQTPELPFKEPKKALETFVKAFNDYKTCYLSIDNQNTFKKFVSQLSKSLHQKSIALDLICSKIVTKTNRSKPVGENVYKRIKELIELGTDRIFRSVSHPEKVIRFSLVFALHAYIYKSDADNGAARSELSDQLGKLVNRMIAYDHQEKQQSTLLPFFKILITEMRNYFKDGSKGASAWFSPLLWTFEALVRNEEFIKYMKPLGKKDSDIPPLALELFSQEKTWRAIADFTVSWGHAELFEKLLKGQIDDKNSVCLLDENQNNVIFRNLNNQIGIWGNKDPYRSMYLSFLKELSKINKLHYLRPYANHRDHKDLLYANLLKLDFSFMRDTKSLESFFGNGTYRALSQNVSLPPGEHVRAMIVRLFSRYGQNPVEEPEKFDTALRNLLAEMDRGFQGICLAILGKMGESAALGVETIEGKEKLIPVERWLSDAVPTYYLVLKTYILMTLPLRWETETFNGVRNLLRRICLYQDKLYLAVHDDKKQIVLKNLFTEELLSPRPESILVADLTEDVKRGLNRNMADQENQYAVSYLTEAYMSFQKHDNIKAQLEDLLNIIFIKMREEVGGDVSFKGRILILADFLNAMAPFFKKIDKITEKRFTHEKKIKGDITRRLVKEAKESKTVEETYHLDIPDGENVTQEFMQKLSTLVTSICTKDIQEILKKNNSLSKLAGVTPKLEYVVSRKIDDLSYSKEDFIDAFCSHPVNVREVASETLRKIIDKLDLKEKIVDDYRHLLTELSPPIHFILSNQALAIQLATCSEFSGKDRNMLLKMGTGQGKSIAIALTALHEAQKVKKNNHKGRVFVFTSYDELARRDQTLGQCFFEKEEIESICISNLGDVSRFSESVIIIYADIENIEHIVREIMLKLLEDNASDPQKEFLRAIYCSPNEEIRLILDEYDILIKDIEDKEPFVMEIPEARLDVDFVRKNSNIWGYLADVTRESPPPDAPKTAADPHTGKRYQTGGWYNHGNKTFNLPPSIMRLSNLIKRANRVIGFSGTALENENHSVPNPLYFEIPSSQDPTVFGTKIEEDDSKIRSESNYIARRKVKQFKIISQEGVSILNESDVKDYCHAIIEDIKDQRAVIQSDSGSYQRPIVIFSDPFFEYKTPQNSNVRKIWDTLKAAILAARLPLLELPAEVLDVKLQEVARSGQVTLTTIRNARGADIRVSYDIDEGLHVCGSIPVANKRLLYQMIGRTGRMGRKGSYSLITFGDPYPKESESNDSRSEFYTSLHNLTGFFVKRLLHTKLDENTRKKWLMFLANAYSTRLNPKPKINKKIGMDLCGTFFEQNVIPEKFLNNS